MKIKTVLQFLMVTTMKTDLSIFMSPNKTKCIFKDLSSFEWLLQSLSDSLEYGDISEVLKSINVTVTIIIVFISPSQIASSSCKPSCVDHHSTVPEDVLLSVPLLNEIIKFTLLSGIPSIVLIKSERDKLIKGLFQNKKLK